MWRSRVVAPHDQGDSRVSASTAAAPMRQHLGPASDLSTARNPSDHAVSVLPVLRCSVRPMSCRSFPVSLGLGIRNSGSRHRANSGEPALIPVEAHRSPHLDNAAGFHPRSPGRSPVLSAGVQLASCTHSIIASLIPFVKPRLGGIRRDVSRRGSRGEFRVRTTRGNRVSRSLASGIEKSNVVLILRRFFEGESGSLGLDASWLDHLGGRGFLGHTRWRMLRQRPDGE
jgi:hypothetical protein